MKIAKYIATIFLLLTVIFLGYQVATHSRTAQHLKQDAAELNHFKYGLFNVDAWKDQLSSIISDEIDKLYLTRKTEKTLKSHLEDQLEVLIDKIYDRIKTKNSKTLGGKFKQSLLESFVDVKDIKAGIPEYAKAMMEEISTPKTEAQIKSMLKERIQKFMQETYDTRPLSLRDYIIKRSGAGDEDTAKETIAQHIHDEQKLINRYALLMVLAVILMMLLEAFNKGPIPPLMYASMSASLIVLLAVGVMTPMIDMEAKISQFNFVLFDNPVMFKNQVLYFQSKSVLDVFDVMISHEQLQMNLVGILVVGFSVIFPTIKMICSIGFYYDAFKARSNKIVQFFVLHSGKWSMADVLVVAIFMAFIGFNGIINSQLKQVGDYTDKVDLMTTNGTALQTGFYVFFSYVILAMFLSLMLKKRPHEKV